MFNRKRIMKLEKELEKAQNKIEFIAAHRKELFIQFEHVIYELNNFMGNVMRAENHEVGNFDEEFLYRLLMGVSFSIWSDDLPKKINLFFDKILDKTLLQNKRIKALLLKNECLKKQINQGIWGKM